MSKQKTRQQKIIADLHRKLQSQSSISSPEKQTISGQQQVRFSYAHTTHPSVPVHTTHFTTNFSSIKQDLYKTVLVTTTIIIAQLLLLYVLKTHMITLPIGIY